MEVKQCDEIRRDGAGGGDQKNGGPYCFHYLFYLFNWVLKAQWDRMIIVLGYGGRKWAKHTHSKEKKML